MVTKMVLPALGLLLTLTLEFQALDRISTNLDKNAQPWTTFGPDLTRAAVLKRVSDHSCEQTLIVAIIALAFGAGPKRVGALDDSTDGFDAGRLAVAIAYVYIVCRPIFAIGYLSADKDGKRDGMGRLPGLVIGGFWMNIGQSVIARALSLALPVITTNRRSTSVCSQDTASTPRWSPAPLASGTAPWSSTAASSSRLSLSVSWSRSRSRRSRPPRIRRPTPSSRG